MCHTLFHICFIPLFHTRVSYPFFVHVIRLHEWWKFGGSSGSHSCCLRCASFSLSCAMDFFDGQETVAASEPDVPMPVVEPPVSEPPVAEPPVAEPAVAQNADWRQIPGILAFQETCRICEEWAGGDGDSPPHAASGGRGPFDFSKASKEWWWVPPSPHPRDSIAPSCRPPLR